jgi:hypothetical protein
MKYFRVIFRVIIATAVLLALGACTESPEKSPAAKPADATKQTKSVATAEMPAASAVQSFCTTEESIVFTCQSGTKQVSVCASRTVSPTAGYVQYRFGSIGAAGKAGAPLEIAHPAGQVHPLKAAYGTGVMFSGGGGAWLRFRNPPYAYVVYSGIGRWGPNGEPTAKEGLVVEKDGVAVAHLKCNGNSSGELGPDWLEKVGYAANSNEQFDFPD